MSIKILAKSFGEHRTIDATTVTTSYSMAWEDYYNGVGDLVDVNGDIITTFFYLPWEGDSFSIYYNTNYLLGVVLTDITMEPTNGLINPFDTTGNDLDKEVIIVYTWSNEGSADTKRNNEASSWKIRYNTTQEERSIDNYTDVLTGDTVVWAHKYYTNTNPDMIMEDDEDLGAYTDAAGHVAAGPPTGIQQSFIDFTIDRVPELTRTYNKTVVNITAYSSDVKGATLSALLNKINQYDLLQNLYTQKELALIEKNKLPGYDQNDWINADDTNKWKFIDWDMEDLGNSFFEYVFYFEYNDGERSDGAGTWDRVFDPNFPENFGALHYIQTDRYEEVDFYDLIFKGMDAILPNVRNGR